MTGNDVQTLSAKLLSVCAERADEQAIIFRDGAYTFEQLRALIAACALHFEEHGLGAGSVLQIESADPGLCIPATIATRVLGAEVLVSEPGYDLDKPSAATHSLTEARTPRGDGVRLIPMTAEGLSPASYTLAARDEMLSRMSAAKADAPWFRRLPTQGEAADGPPITVTDAELLSRTTPLASALLGQGGRLAVVHSSIMSYSALLRLLSALAGGCAVVEPGSWDFWHQARVSAVSVDLPNVPNLLRASDLTRRLPLVELSGDAASNGAISELSERFDHLHCQFETAATGAIWHASLPSGTPISAPFGQSVDPSTSLTVKPLDSRSSSAPGVLTKATGDGDALANLSLLAVAAAGTGGIRLLGRMWGETLERDGQSIDPSRIDGVLKSVDGIIDAIAFRTPKAGVDEIIAFTIFAEDADRDAIVDRASALCMDHLGVAFVPSKFRPIRAIPRQPNGMPDRSACAALILSALS